MMEGIEAVGIWARQVPADIVLKLHTVSTNPDRDTNLIIAHQNSCGQMCLCLARKKLNKDI
jgi:hypothetical protein